MVRVRVSGLAGMFRVRVRVRSPLVEVVDTVSRQPATKEKFSFVSSRLQIKVL